MFDISTVQLDWQGLNLKLETGIVADKLICRSGNTWLNKCALHCMCSKKSDPTIDFFHFCSLYQLMLQEKYSRIF